MEPKKQFIDMTKQYKTRDGRDVRIYAVDGSESHPIHGAILQDGQWCSAYWTASGYAPVYRDSLVEVKPERTAWLNVYPNSPATKEDADRIASANRIACVQVAFREGDGL